MQTNLTSDNVSPVDPKATVQGLVRGGVLLINIVNSSTYPDEVREAAMRLIRVNVLGVQRLKKEISQ